MTKSQAVNAALVSVSFGWAAVAYAVVSRLGDYGPATPVAVMRADYRFSLCLGFLGVAMILGAVGLAGYAFVDAKIRASLVVFLVAAPLVALVVLGYQQ